VTSQIRAKEIKIKEIKIRTKENNNKTLENNILLGVNLLTRTKETNKILLDKEKNKNAPQPSPGSQPPNKKQKTQL